MRSVQRCFSIWAFTSASLVPEWPSCSHWRARAKRCCRTDDMEFYLAIVVGVMVTAAVYMMLQRSLVRFVIGFTLLSNAANVAIFTDRKSTRLNSSHVAISYAVFCLKKKKTL